jgi:hypothetical protein
MLGLNKLYEGTNSREAYGERRGSFRSILHFLDADCIQTMPGMNVHVD